MTKAVQVLENGASGGTALDLISAEKLRSRVAELESSVRHLEECLSAYESIFFENPIPALVYAVESLHILEGNASALALYRYDRSDLCQMNLLDLFCDGKTQNCDELAEQLRKPLHSAGPFLHRRADGKQLVVSLTFFTVQLRNIDARIVMVQDATERQAAEEELRASEERFRELFENANDVIFIHDLGGKIIAVNRAAEGLTGYSRKELAGKNFEELISPEARNRTHDSIRAHLGGSATQHYELPIQSKFGTPRFLEVSTRIIYRRGHPVAIQGIGRDVTERKRTQQRILESAQELRRTNEELSTALKLAREATQLKEQFLANTSHELRTPMNGIMGMINLLKDTELTSDQREYADAVSQCANDLLTIINDLLDLSQMEAGRLALNFEPFDGRESLRAVVKLLSLKAAAKDLALTYEIDPGVPAMIYGDSVRFRQILTNLIANAVKFTQVGGVHVHLKRKANGHLRCEIIDTGIGVAEALQNRIFEAFFQADGTTRRRFGGTGLGLTISKQLAETMGGQIGTYNNVNSPGATFWFETPLAAASLDDSTAWTAASQQMRPSNC